MTHYPKSILLRSEAPWVYKLPNRQIKADQNGNPGLDWPEPESVSKSVIANPLSKETP